MAITVEKYDVLTVLLGKFDLTVVTSVNGIFVALMNSAHSMTSANTVFADVSTNSHDTGGGYTQFDPGGGTPTGGALLSAITLVESDGVATFDAGDVEWTASGDTIPASARAFYAVMVSMASATGALMFNIDFDGSGTGAEQAGDGTKFKITWNGSGIYTLDSNP